MTVVRSFRCRAILFDMDGVLVNSEERVEKMWREWAMRHRFDPDHVIAMAHGRRTIDTVRLVAPELDTDTELAVLEANEATNSEGVYEIAGARELLLQLPRSHWAVVTSAIRSVAEFRLQHMRLPSPAVLICADEITHGKPDPEGYLTAASRLGCAAADCIVIEDAPAGIESAQAAGMRALAIATTYPAEQLKAADAVIARLGDLSVEHARDELLINLH